jgi:hypothetical protein
MAAMRNEFPGNVINSFVYRREQQLRSAAVQDDFNEHQQALCEHLRDQARKRHEQSKTGQRKPETLIGLMGVTSIFKNDDNGPLYFPGA